jgi:hypothetical protein
MMPFLGYFNGDFIPLLFLGDETGTVGQLVDTFAEHVVDIRVARRSGEYFARHNGRDLDLSQTVTAAGIGPLDTVYMGYR